MEKRFLNVRKGEKWSEEIDRFVANTRKVRITKTPIDLDFYEPDRGKVAFVLDGVLSESECKFFINYTEELGYKTMLEYDPLYRSNTRVITDEPSLSLQLFERVSSFLPSTMPHYNNATWKLVGLNERFRFCKYVPGQHFDAHFDACFSRNAKEMSFLTFMIYLSGEGNDGGETCFLKTEDGTIVTNTKSNRKKKKKTIKNQTGSKKNGKSNRDNESNGAVKENEEKQEREVMEGEEKTERGEKEEEAEVKEQKEDEKDEREEKDENEEEEKEEDPRVTFKYKPKAGSVLIFQHNIYHEGRRLQSGVKYLMRSDVIYRSS